MMLNSQNEAQKMSRSSGLIRNTARKENLTFILYIDSINVYFFSVRNVQRSVLYISLRGSITF